jgi:uncharacterized membrane protein YesL
MAKLDYDEKLNSKPYRFFDLLYRIVVLNIVTIILSLTIVLMYPAVVCAYATLKEGNKESGLFRQYLNNFKKYFKKAFASGIIIIILLALAMYSMYFYYNSTSDVTITNLFINAGFMVGFFSFLVILFICAHIPLVIITFNDLNVSEIFKTSFYITFRYFLTTLIIFVFNVLIIGGLIFCMFVPGFLAIWMPFGVCLPIYLIVKITYPIYYKLEKIDFKKIKEDVDDEMEENDE